MDLFLCEAQRNALLLNDGAGNFAPAAWTGDGTFCASAVSDDFNSDGWPGKDAPLTSSSVSSRHHLLSDT